MEPSRKHNEPRFLPQPDELERRARYRKEATLQGWDSLFVYSVLMEDHPNLGLVESLSKEVGNHEAYNKLREFWRE